jgi:hypothetical protein
MPKKQVKTRKKSKLKLKRLAAKKRVIKGHNKTHLKKKK